MNQGHTVTCNLDSEVGEKRRTFRVIKDPDGTFNDGCQKCYLKMEKVF